MKRATVALMIAAGCLSLARANDGDGILSRPVGVVRHEIKPSETILAGMPFDPVSDSSCNVVVFGEPDCLRITK